MKVTSLVASIPFFLLSLLSMRASADSVDFGTNSQINRPYQISIKFDEAPDKVNLPLFDVSLRRSIMRLSSAVPRPSVSQTASD